MRCLKKAVGPGAGPGLGRSLAMAWPWVGQANFDRRFDLGRKIQKETCSECTSLYWEILADPVASSLAYLEPPDPIILEQYVILRKTLCFIPSSEFPNKTSSVVPHPCFSRIICLTPLRLWTSMSCSINILFSSCTPSEPSIAEFSRVRRIK